MDLLAPRLPLATYLPSIKALTTRGLIVEYAIRAPALAQVAEPLHEDLDPGGQRRQFDVKRWKRARRGADTYARTSSHAPTTPIPIPLATITNHIRDAANVRRAIPRSPRCERSACSRARSAASSCSQSIVSPSAYVARARGPDAWSAARSVSSSASSKSSASSARSVDFARGRPRGVLVLVESLSSRTQYMRRTCSTDGHTRGRPSEAPPRRRSRQRDRTGREYAPCSTEHSSKQFRSRVATTYAPFQHRGTAAAGVDVENEEARPGVKHSAFRLHLPNRMQAPPAPSP